VTCRCRSTLPTKTWPRHGLQQLNSKHGSVYNKPRASVHASASKTNQFKPETNNTYQNLFSLREVYENFTELHKAQSHVKNLVFGLYLEPLTLMSVCTEGFSTGLVHIFVFLRTLWLHAVNRGPRGARATSRPTRLTYVRKYRYKLQSMELSTTV
jgi:hypothetical protein